MRSLSLLLLLLLPASGFAQDLLTDRPDFTESAVVVPRGTVQFEGGVTWERTGSFDAVNAPELLVRWAFLPNLELRFGAPNYFRTNGPDGFGDSSIGAKMQLGPVGAWDLAAIATLSLPTGEAGFTSDRVEPELVLTASRALAERISLGTQVMAGYATGAEEITLAGTLVVGVSLQEAIGQFTELAVFNVQQDTPALFLHHGYTFLLLPLLQLDLHGGVGLTRSAPDYFLGLGISTRL